MLKGTLDDFTLPDIFRLMSLSKKTGQLEVQRSAGSGKVFFRDGEVYFAESTLSKEPLGQKLVHMKVVTEGQLRKALDQHKSEGKRLGQVLLETEMVTEDDIMTAVRQQIEDAAFDLLRWELGEFVWEPGVETEPEVPIYVSVENLIMEASRRLDELEVIQRKIPSGDTVLAMAATPPQGAVEINITPNEWQILVLVNGHRTVDEIAEFTGLDQFAAMKVLYGMASAGLIEVPGREDVETEPLPSSDDQASGEAHEEQPEAQIEEPASAEQEASEEPTGPPEMTVVQGSEIAEGEVEVPVEEFDAPQPGDLTAQMPSEEELAAEILSPEAAFPELDKQEEAETAAQAAPEAPPAPEPAAEAPAEPEAPVDIPVSSASAGESPGVDRIAAVRELAGLFTEHDEESSENSASRPVRTPSAEGDQRKRVEDDDQVTRGLISRLIDGVKGL
jgi:hypothetical protein